MNATDIWNNIIQWLKTPTTVHNWIFILSILFIIVYIIWMGIIMAKNVRRKILINKLKDEIKKWCNQLNNVFIQNEKAIKTLSDEIETSTKKVEEWKQKWIIKSSQVDDLEEKLNISRNQTAIIEGKYKKVNMKAEAMKLAVMALQSIDSEIDLMTLYTNILDKIRKE